MITFGVDSWSENKDSSQLILPSTANHCFRVKNYSLILQEIDVYLECHEISESQKTDDLQQIIASSNKVLKDVEKALIKYSKLERPGDSLRGSNLQGSSLRGCVHRIWQRATWEPEDIRDFRSRLNANVIQLSAFAEGFNRQSVTKLVERQTRQINQEVLDWISPPDYASQHADHADHRLPDTGQWFINSSSYEQWREDTDTMLILSGIPGAGKTVLSSIIIDDLQELCNRKVNMKLCYYYCDYNRLQNQQLDTILLCLLRQLVQTMLVLPTAVRRLYDTCSENASRPSSTSIKDAFREIAKSLQKVYIVIDALDESQTTNGLRMALLVELLKLSELGNIKMLVTSRPLPDILNTLVRFTCIEIRASDTDIAKYVEANVPNLPAFVGRQPTLQNDIKEAVVAASDGMYVLLNCFDNAYTRSVSCSQHSILNHW